MASFVAKVTSKGQVTIPAQMREAMRIAPGDKVVFTDSADGAYRVVAQNRTLGDLRGIVKSGPLIAGAQIHTWIEEARAGRISEGLDHALRKPARRR